MEPRGAAARMQPIFSCGLCGALVPMDAGDTHLAWHSGQGEITPLQHATFTLLDAADLPRPKG